MTRHGERSTRPRGRPVEAQQRPERIAIRAGIVRCYYRNCFYVDGPYPTREQTVTAARHHYEECHRRV